MDAKQACETLDIPLNEQTILRFAEALGELVLITHWQRGLLKEMFWTLDKAGLVGDKKENWQRLLDSMELYEQYVWEVVPARLATASLNATRKRGSDDYPDDLKKSNESDSHGRIRYDETRLEDLEDIVRHIEDVTGAAPRATYGHANNLFK